LFVFLIIIIFFFFNFVFKPQEKCTEVLAVMFFSLSHIFTNTKENAKYKIQKKKEEMMKMKRKKKEYIKHMK